MKLSGLVIAISLTGMLLSTAAYSQGAPVVRASGQSGSETVQERLDRLERMLAGRTQGQAEMMERLNRLQRELSDLRGITEEHAHQLEQMLQRQRDIYQELDRIAEQLRSGAGASAPTAAPTLPTSSVSFSENRSENADYDRAVALVLQERNYDQAIPLFRSFLETYPGSSYTSNAHYWLGQLYYAQENYPDAITHFTTVMEQFPDSNKRADCILKLGLIAANQNNRDRARRFFNQVRSEYPNSTEAGMAARQLEGL